MSAKNYSKCPKCVLARKIDIGNRKDRLKDQYGKLPFATWENEKRQLQEIESTPPEDTLREDYELWIDEHAIFHMYYGARCENCGFEFNFKHNEDTER
jgi:hypothetical protein